jgi:hypothetical protein
MNDIVDIINWTEFWTFVAAIATIALALIAYFQLNKLRATNNSQILVHFEDEWNSNSMKDKRIELSKKLKVFIETPEDKKNCGDIDLYIQPVFDFIEKVALLTNEGNFELKWVYHLYAYAIQNYWELVTNTGYFTYVRKMNNGVEIYDQTEILYYKIINVYHLTKYSENDLLGFLEEEINLTKYRD